MKLLTALLPLLLVACASKPVVKKDANGNELPEKFEKVGGQPTQTDIARFLAGRPVYNGANLSQLQQTPEYQGFSRGMLQKWKFRSSRRIDEQNTWQANYIAPLASSRTVLYPFGGPDLLYVMGLFPNSSRYILLGLEPAGGLPDLEHTAPADTMSALYKHSKSIETELIFGYFITKDMKADLSNGALQGVAPILLSELGLMNATINSIQNTSAGGRSAIDIDFTVPGLGRKSVTYVSGDLSNGGFQGSYASWLSSSASGSVAYFKAASYLMHDSSFSSVRNWVLGNCRALVQDDSGLPYSAYDPQKWDIHLYGNYNGPIEFFAKHNQPDLKAAYDRAGLVPAVTFGSGYHLTPSTANLMVAVRK